MKQIYWIAAALSFFSLLGCSKDEQSVEDHPYETEPTIRQVLPLLAEGSGIADSKINPGYLWVHEDGGNPAQLYLLGHDGKVAKTILLQGIVNTDWEDIMLAEGHLYLADTGDNKLKRESYAIHRFPEPGTSASAIPVTESIHFTYEDGAHDAEAFLVDPLSKDIYLFTKSESPSRMYKLTYPYQAGRSHTAVLVGALPYNAIVSAAMSPDGKEVIIKTYSDLYYYKRSGSESVEQVLQKAFVKLPYVVEPQGEAVTFSIHNNGYYTLSESDVTDKVSLYFYKKK